MAGPRANQRAHVRSVERAFMRVRSLGAVSHAIRLGELSIMPTNVAIPTMWICSTTKCWGNCMRNSWAAHPTGVMRRGRTPPIAQPMAQTAARQWPGTVDAVGAGELSPEAECPYQATRSPAHQGRVFPDLNAATAVAHSPAHQGHGSIHTPTMKQSPSMVIFPHQQAEKSLHNQHVLSILHVGSHRLQHRFFRTKKPKSRHTTNTFCPGTPITRSRRRARRTPVADNKKPALADRAPDFRWS